VTLGRFSPLGGHVRWDKVGTLCGVDAYSGGEAGAYSGDCDSDGNRYSLPVSSDGAFGGVDACEGRKRPLASHCRFLRDRLTVVLWWFWTKLGLSWLFLFLSDMCRLCGVLVLARLLLFGGVVW